MNCLKSWFICSKTCSKFKFLIYAKLENLELFRKSAFLENERSLTFLILEKKYKVLFVVLVVLNIML